MTKIIKLLMGDKAVHLYLCYILFDILQLFMERWAAAIIVVAVMISKELWARRKPNPTGFSIPDIAFGCAGVALSWIINTL